MFHALSFISLSIYTIYILQFHIPRVNMKCPSLPWWIFSNPQPFGLWSWYHLWCWHIHLQREIHLQWWRLDPPVRNLVWLVRTTPNQLRSFARHLVGKMAILCYLLIIKQQPVVEFHLFWFGLHEFSPLSLCQPENEAWKWIESAKKKPSSWSLMIIYGC